MIVEAGKRKHGDEADGEPANLLHVHAGKRAAVGSGINLDYAQGADGCEDCQQPPVVIACAGSFFHDFFASRAESVEIIVAPRIAIRELRRAESLQWEQRA